MNTQATETRPNTLGTATPLLASAPIKRIVREVTTARNDRFRVLYMDGQSVDLYLRPDTSDDRVREIATGLR
jgi:hypothetical protein